jgi:hypothetical protein
MRRLHRSAVVAALVVLGTAPGPAWAADPTPAPSSTAPITGESGSGKPTDLTFGIKPYDEPGAAPRANYRYQLAPGASVTDRVSIYNYATVPLDLSLYATDGFTNASGSFTVNTGPEKPTAVGTWVALSVASTSLLRIQPRTRVDVAFDLTIPKDAEPGDHAGGIVVSLKGRTTGEDGATSVNVDSRVATSLKVRVTGQVRPELQVENLTASYTQNWNPIRPGSVTLRYTVRNTGNIAQGAVQTATLAGPFGWGSATRTPGRIEQVLPGDSVDVEVTFDDVWPFVRYAAAVQLQATAASGDPLAADVVAQTDLWALPVPQALLLLVLLLVGLGLAEWRRRSATRQPPSGGRHGGPPTTETYGRRSKERALLS